MKNFETEDILSVLDQEIAFCQTHQGESDKGLDFENGFLEGVKHSKALILKLHFVNTLLDIKELNEK